MFDLNNQKVDVRCECGRKHTATLRDVSNQRSIRCLCGVTIQLQDNGGSVRRNVSSINKSMSDLEKMFKKLGR